MSVETGGTEQPGRNSPLSEGQGLTDGSAVMTAAILIRQGNKPADPAFADMLEAIAFRIKSADSRLAELTERLPHMSDVVTLERERREAAEQSLRTARERVEALESAIRTHERRVWGSSQNKCNHPDDKALYALVEPSAALTGAGEK